MLKKRIIPVLLLKDGYLVRSETFSLHQRTGNPYHQVERYNSWNVDELIYLDISRKSSNNGNPMQREKYNCDILSRIARKSFMPLTFGGGIRTLEQIRSRLSLGADKISINTIALEDPEFINAASKRFGSQAIVVSIDTRKKDDGTHEVYTECGTRSTRLTPESWAEEVQKRGAGEILLNSINNDGMQKGYDVELASQVSLATTIPVIACGGAGDATHVCSVLNEGRTSAAAIGNMLQFRELSYVYIKESLIRDAVPIRKNREHYE
jgi:imidazole glycerol-phosphate synthase subunit HisF